MNYMTASELTEVRMLLDALTNIDESISDIGIGNVPICDSNGETLGHLVYSECWKFYPGETVPE